MNIRIALILDYHDLERIAKLFQMLYAHFPNAWVSFEMHGKLQPAIQPILWLKENLKPEDRTYLDSLGPSISLVEGAHSTSAERHLLRLKDRG
jgi:hypothetical protein